MTSSKRFTLLGIAAGIVLTGFSPAAHASVSANLGWESGPEASWSPSTPSTTTVVPSGGGALGLTAPGGSFYAEAGIAPNTYIPGYGSAGSTNLGGRDTSYRGKFFQAFDIYINPATWSSSVNGSLAMDMTPANPTGSAYEFSLETGIRFSSASNGPVSVVSNLGAGPTMTSITTAGWYTFALTFSKSGNLTTDPVQIDFTAWTLPTREQLGLTQTVFLGASSNLGGHGYEWLTIWENGYANNVVGIDNLRTSLGEFVIPEPASFALLASGGVMLLVRRRRA